jgi:hypothetical protein
MASDSATTRGVPAKGHWAYRNIDHNRKPPCPLCGNVRDALIEKPTHPSGKWTCKVGNCGAKYQATWVPDEGTATAPFSEEGDR